ncbi:unnamed protein product, partial [Mesorhabditis belari]|uniref:Uncharacterized protein n=1 Tax=Mesorhabditis belari TaxID=2138241 RepID=A0AAF3FB87_9BILA
MLAIFHFTFTADPVEQFFRTIALTAKQLGERWISQVSIPTINDIGNPYAGGLMSNIDPKTATALGSLTETVDRLMAKQFLSSRKTLGSLFREEARVECATIQ